MRTDVYQRITDQIREAILRKAVRPWFQAVECRAWLLGASRGPCAVMGNGIPYQGINVLMLWSSGKWRKGYAAPVWMTFKQGVWGSGPTSARARQEVLSCTPTRSSAPRPMRRRAREAERAIPFMKGYNRFQCRADRRAARALLRHAHPAQPRPCSGSRRAEIILRRDRRKRKRNCLRRQLGVFTASRTTQVRMAAPVEAFRRC